MRALSVLQPWPWLIVRPDIVSAEARQHAYAAGLIKDIENRVWRSHFRGEFLVHASQTYSRRQHVEYAEFFATEFGIQLPSYEDLPRGGIVGRATMVDCVEQHDSRWKNDGTYGFVLRDAAPLPFIRWSGERRFFDVPDHVIQPYIAATSATRAAAPSHSTRSL